MSTIMMFESLKLCLSALNTALQPFAYEKQCGGVRCFVVFVVAAVRFLGECTVVEAAAPSAAVSSADCADRKGCGKWFLPHTDITSGQSPQLY